MPLDFDAARQTMVETQVRTNDVPDPAIQEAMRQAPREALCGVNTHLAYADAEVEYAPGQYLMRPRDVAKLLYAVRPKAGERALAIAAPYAGAVLELMGLQVETVPADGVVSGQFDVILTEGAVSAAPQSWLTALAPGGRLGVVEKDGPAGRARIYLRSGDGIGSRDTFDASPPTLPGFEKKPEFSF
jgi:protein-L-isoaspartate(D-aspartate) O-methyltransferase